MFNKNIKLVIAVLIIAYAVFQFIEGNIGNGIALILLSLVFIFLYFRNEFILLAFLKMRKQDLDGVQGWLDKIKNPELDSIGYWGLENRYNLQKYLPGGGYPQPHCEASFKNNCHRVIVWMIYLNTVTDDGGTRFPQYDLTTDAVAGRVVLWPTSWTHFHHGIISKTQYKYIATGWYSFMS